MCSQSSIFKGSVCKWGQLENVTLFQVLIFDICRGCSDGLIALLGFHGLIRIIILLYVWLSTGLVVLFKLTFGFFGCDAVWMFLTKTSLDWLNAAYDRLLEHS